MKKIPKGGSLEKGATVLVTGMAGFIGFHCSRRLHAEGCRVLGLDNLSPYYDVALKKARLRELGFTMADIDSQPAGAERPIEADGILFYRLDLLDRPALSELFQRESPRWIVHLAAQPGVRYSLQNPYSYVDSNVSGFLNLLECCRRQAVSHLVFASSSSVYGSNRSLPFSVRQNVDHPVSLYAATKKAGELMAHSYAHLFSLPVTGLRFFTVYGPWGRPDMAMYSFTEKIWRGEPIEIYNHGRMKRDFTFIDDVVTGVTQVLRIIPWSNADWDGQHPDPATSAAPYRLFNIGNHQPVDLLYFIELIEKNLAKKAEKRFLPLQAGDMEETFADIDDLHQYAHFAPATPIEEGVRRFVDWFKEYQCR